MYTRAVLHLVFLLISAGVFIGCGNPTANSLERAATPKPKEAATQLELAFAGADAGVKSYATVASLALQKADYEAAVQALQTLKAQGNLTMDQGLAVHNAMIALEARLISAMDAGDANAQRAYEQLKKARRN